MKNLSSNASDPSPAGVIPSASLSRLALYLRAVQLLESQGVKATNSQRLAELAGVQPFHVRKDLAYCGRFGRRGQGYAVSLLRRELSRSLGLNRRWHYIVVGVGLLGQALLKLDWGDQFVCVGLFDPQPQYQGQRLEVAPLPQLQPSGQLPPPARELRVKPLSDLSTFLQEQNADIALLTLSDMQGQEALNTLRQAGIGGILSVGSGTLASPTHLQECSDEENDTMIEQVDFQVSLQRLAFALLNKPTP